MCVSKFVIVILFNAYLHTMDKSSYSLPLHFYFVTFILVSDVIYYNYLPDDTTILMLHLRLIGGIL